jgi:hypothetical protein
MKTIILTLAAAALTFAQSAPATAPTAPQSVPATHSAPAHKAAKHGKKTQKTSIVKPAAHRAKKHRTHRAGK